MELKKIKKLTLILFILTNIIYGAAENELVNQLASINSEIETLEKIINMTELNITLLKNSDEPWAPRKIADDEEAMIRPKKKLKNLLEEKKALEKKLNL